MTAIARLAELKSFGLPLLVGASRKRFIDKVSPAAPDQRLGGSIAAHVLAAADGAAIIRTHDVAETVQALRVAAAIRERAMTDAVFVTGLVPPRLSRRDAARGQGRPDLQSRPRPRHRPRPRRRAPTSSRTRWATTRSSRSRAKAFGARRYRLVEAAAGAVAARHPRAVPAGRAGAGHRPQAARADRGDLCRCRGHHRARAPRPMAEALSRSAAMSGRDRRHPRSRDRRALRRRRRAPSGPLRRTTARRPGGSTDQPPFVNLCIAVETEPDAARAA